MPTATRSELCTPTRGVLRGHRPFAASALPTLATSGLVCALAICGALTFAPNLDAQTRQSRTGNEPTGITRFAVDAERTRIVHGNRATPIGEDHDTFTSWLELPTRELATAGVRGGETGTRALVVLVDAAGVAKREVMVPSARGATQATPKLLAPRTRDQAFGVAWFEGSSHSQRELFFSQALEQDGTVSFARPVRVAAQAAGSQVALDAVTLPDGRYLAIWSAFDGTDTEIMYTVGEGESWSRPQPLHPGDETPDSLPSLVRTPDGALVAWNSLEGHTYAVMTSAFDGSEWSTPHPVDALPGVEPAWTRGADRPLLSFKQRGGWTFVQTDTNGHMQRRARAADTTQRPTVVSVNEAGVELLESELLEAQRLDAAPEGTALPAKRREPAIRINLLEWQR